MRLVSRTNSCSALILYLVPLLVHRLSFIHLPHFLTVFTIAFVLFVGRVLSALKLSCDQRGWIGVTGWATDFSTSRLFDYRAHSFFFSMWSGGTSLHRAEERLSRLWGRFLHALFACMSQAVSPRPELVKLLALSHFPAKVHCRTGHGGQSFLFVRWYFLSSVLPSSWSNVPLVTGISNLMASLRRFSFFAHWWRELRNGSLVSDALIRGGYVHLNLFV